jgi:endogenous inhibitor of DNA gyrase (YacG/DUF329 family)
MKTKCPTCKREGDWFNGLYGPFCSKRCKLVDLGKWFGEEHVISKPLAAEDQEKPPYEPHDSSGPGLTD